MGLLALTDRAAEVAALGGGELLGGGEIGGRGNAHLDGLGETDLVILGEEIVAAYIFEVETYEILVVAVLTTGLDVLSGHIAAFRVSLAGGILLEEWALISYRPYEEPDRVVGQNVRRGSGVPRAGLEVQWGGDRQARL